VSVALAHMEQVSTARERRRPRRTGPRARRVAGALATLGVVLLAGPALAVFHVTRINEVMSGAAGNPNIQYVEVRMLVGAQNADANTRLTAFSCDGSSHTVLLLLPNGVANQGIGVTFLMASPDDATVFAAAGIHPDFTFAPGLAPVCGMVCWGAPGIAAPAPASWDPADPNSYVDCLAYGGYTGPRKTSTHDGTPASGTPATLPAGDGTHSLSRTSDTQDNLADFAATCPTPMSNAGSTGSFGPCTPMVGTTTTTLAPGALACSDASAAAATRARIAEQCSCAGASSHHAYVKCAVAAMNTAVKAGMLPKSCRGPVKKCAASSTCGHPGSVTCCRTTAGGVRKCHVKKSARGCKAPKGGVACVGLQTSCCDPCTGPSCSVTTPTTTPGASTTTTTRRRTTSSTMPPYP
jgi:hypothetical protein